MGDLLIRNLDDALKQQLQERAKRNGRSMSDEAAALLRRLLAVSDEDREPAGDWLRSLAGSEYWTSDELAAIEAARHEPEREPPKFEQ